jgi:nitrite reductase (NADH) small subunit
MKAGTIVAMNASRTETALETVCTIDDLVPGAGVCALVRGRQVAIFYVPDAVPELYAIGNHDPIGGANVLYRGIVADVGGELTVASPLYKQHFSLTTGRCVEEPDHAVPVYAIAREGVTIRVGV